MKQFAPSTERNRDPILTELRGVLPETGTVLEVASGSGQHVVHFAHQLPGIIWQPSDSDQSAVDSISAWNAEAGLSNVAPPLLLDVRADAWPVGQLDAVININMIHISHWSCCLGLMAGAGRSLGTGGALIMYGPYLVDDRPTADSNRKFDLWLRDRDPAFGLRYLHDVRRAAEQNGLAFERMIDMPANNLMVIYRRSQSFDQLPD